MISEKISSMMTSSAGGGGGGYFLDSWWSMLPGFPNPDPISEQEMSFFTPVFRPGV